VSWDHHHSLSEKLAIDGDATNRTGDLVRAQDLFARAATEESAALDALPQEKHRTRGITAVSAVALWFKARDYVAAERLANRCLEDPQMPHFAQKQLRDLLNAIQTASAAGKPATRTTPSGSELFIVDNSDLDWKVVRYLHDWADISTSFDIATGCFEIGSLLALDGQWQKLDKIRILMGAETTQRTRQALLEALKKSVTSQLDSSIENAKDKNDFLDGVPAITDALRNNRIECRVYTKKKFHAKAYITHAKMAVVGSAALVGSSNFTQPGLEDNVELNIQLRREVELLQQWFNRHWTEAEDVTPEVIRVIDRHVREYPPFLVYAKALQEFFKGHEMTVGEWEQNASRTYRILDQYQKEGYQALMKIAGQYSGAFLCDGVGLGKTFIGLMLIDRLVNHERKRVALIVPKAARGPVWERELRRRLPNLYGAFSNLLVLNHTDLNRTAKDVVDDIQKVKDAADVIIVDEAHHFRNPGVKGEGDLAPSRYWKLFELCAGKTVFFLTATPINNSLLDLQHMIELFSQRQADYFKAAPLGIHSLPGHFRKMERALEAVVGKNGDGIIINQAEAEEVLRNDDLFRSLVVQRSRAYVKASQLQHGATQVIFPTREPPAVADYSVKKTYGRLLSMIDDAFSKSKPLFSLAIYFPLAFFKGEISLEDKFEEGRQKQVVGLIRIQFLKRFESSAFAFEQSCINLLFKLLAFVTKHSTETAEIKRLDRWKAQNEELLNYVQIGQAALHGEEAVEGEDLITEEMLEVVTHLPRDQYKVEEILQESFLDLDQIAKFVEELRKFKPAHDDKLRALIKLLKTDPVLKKHKVLIFSEFMATARYLKRQLVEAGIPGVDEVDSDDKRDRGDVIKRFAPYYNDSSSSELQADGMEESRVLISTDVLSEGLNLQDATRLINYDLHWNPVRLMQRIGRVDRRMNPEVEALLLADHPDQKGLRGTVAYWNFLPPDELDVLLSLYSKVSHKALRISKTFGIEGKRLLRPEDDYEALKEFNHAYEGSTTKLEEMHLEYQKLLQNDPGLELRLNALPGRLFSGKANTKADTRAVFFCYALPAPPAQVKGEELQSAEEWTEEAGHTRWYLSDLEAKSIVEEPSQTIDYVRCLPTTPRQQIVDRKTLSEVRVKIERHIKNSYLKQVQAPIGVKPVLKAWMELS
jgi:superfamily II DNA or RNA helicase